MFRFIALLPEQVGEYNLPQNPAKRTDSRSAAFMAQFGDVAVELDALPPNVLQELVRMSIERFLDKTAFEEEGVREQAEQERLEELIGAVGAA